MSKGLIVTITLNLIASAVLIAFGTMLFMEKQLIKTRPLMMRDSLDRISKNLKWGEEVAEFKLEDQRFSGSFILPQPVKHQDIAPLQARVGNLSSFASGRIGHLGGVHRNLVQTRNTLENTKNELATRERELSEARTEIARLEGEIETTQGLLAQARGRISTLQGEITGLQTRLDTLNADLVDRNNQLQTLNIDVEAAIEERNLLVADYKACRLGASGEGSDSGEWRGRTAKILEVNKDWNFVVINKGLADKLKGEIQAYVHRGNEYVGKLEVIEVDNTVSVARIIPDSVPEGVDLVAGDTLFF